MAYVTGYKHDVFISYAHLDNKPYLESEPGWVSQLVKLLHTRLAQELGTDDIDIWMDYRLQGKDAVTPAITEALAGSALLLFVVSNGYLNSPWCGQELASFLKTSVGDRSTGSYPRLFMVQRTKTDRFGLPEALQDLIGYRFWKEETGKPPVTLGYPNLRADEDRYWELLNRLGVEIGAALKCLKGIEKEKPEGGPAVLLAEVTEDLEPQRQDVERFLRQAGVRVLPRSYYPRDTPGKFQDAIDRDLLETKLFVQLLSGIPGRRPPELPQGFPGLQYQRAQVAGKEILQWRPASVKLDDCEEEYRKLLSARTVIVENIQSFKERAQKRAFAPPPSPAAAAKAAEGPPGRGKRIFVNTESGDREIAQQIADCITRKGFLNTLSRETSIRKDLEKRLRECDGAIIVFASSTARWVERQLSYIAKILLDVDPPPPVIEIARITKEGQPPDDIRKTPYNTIHFGETIDCAALEPFLEKVQKHERGSK
jgi:hypothetical protein